MVVIAMLVDNIVDLKCVLYLPLSAGSLLGNRDYIDKYLLSIDDIDILYG